MDNRLWWRALILRECVSWIGGGRSVTGRRVLLHQQVNLETRFLPKITIPTPSTSSGQSLSQRTRQGWGTRRWLECGRSLLFLRRIKISISAFRAALYTPPQRAQCRREGRKTAVFMFHWPISKRGPEFSLPSLKSRPADLPKRLTES